MRQAAIITLSRLPVHLLRFVCLLVWFACLSLAQPFVAVAQTNAPAPLPSAAQEAINKGILAAKIPDYLLAIRYFEEARKIAPQAPVIYLNMGLAESRIPGRELRAIAWFGAYLAAYPDAPNAAAVREQIAVLEVTSQGNIFRLMKSVQEAANQMDTANQSLDDFSASVARISNLSKVAELWAEAGDVSSALKVADLFQGPSAYAKDMAQALIARGQATSGDTAGALKTVGMITQTNYDDKSSALLMVGRVRMWRYDNTGAGETLTLARQVAGQMDDTQTRIYRIAEIASVQAEAGDISGAQESVGLIHGEYAESAQLAIVSAQAKSGDFEGARKTADFIQDAARKILAQESIAKILAKADIPNSQGSITQTDNQTASQGSVTSYNWINQLENTYDTEYTQGYCYGSCPLNTTLHLDLAGHLDTLPTSGDPQTIFDALYTTASKIIIAKNVLHDLLNKQVQR